MKGACRTVRVVVVARSGYKWDAATIAALAAILAAIQTGGNNG